MSDDDNSALSAGIVAYDAQDFREARRILMPLAEAGNPKAQCYVASMFQGGLGCAIDGEKAVEFFRKAAIQNEMDEKVSGLAYHNLGTIYSVGLPGIPANASLAKECWRKAGELGSNLTPRDWYD